MYADTREVSDNTFWNFAINFRAPEVSVPREPVSTYGSSSNDSRKLFALSLQNPDLYPPSETLLAAIAGNLEYRLLAEGFLGTISKEKRMRAFSWLLHSFQNLLRINNSFSRDFRKILGVMGEDISVYLLLWPEEMTNSIRRLIFTTPFFGAYADIRLSMLAYCHGSLEAALSGKAPVRNGWTLSGTPISPATGEEIQPAEGSIVDVSLSLEDEAVENDALNIVHFGEQADVMDTTVDAESIRFETTGFSVYAFIETVLEKTVLTSDGYNYEIRAAYDAESGIPADAELSVEEITDGFSVYGKSYEEYVADTEHALDIAEGTTEYIRLFDISIVDKNDHSIKYQPAEGSSVEVTIELADSQHDNLNVVHFADENDGWSVVDTWSLADTDTDWPTVIFDADSFSVYSIVEAPPPVSFDPNKLSTVSEIEENKAYVFSYDTPEKYFTAALNNNGALIESSESGDAAEWYFEKVSGADNTYYIYTLDNGVKQYIRQKNNGNEIQLAASGTAFNLSDSPTANKFYFKHSSQFTYFHHGSRFGETQ